MLERRKGYRMFLSLVVLTGLLVLLGGIGRIRTYAAVTQDTYEQRAMHISWTDQASSTRRIDRYKIYLRKYNETSDHAVLVQTLPGTQTQTTLTGLQPGTRYYVQVKYDFTYNSSYNARSYTDTVLSSATVQTAPGDITGLHQTKWWFFALILDVAWDKQDGVDGYEYVCYKSNNKLQEKGTTSGNWPSVSIRKIKNEMIYTFKVRSYGTFNGQTYYGNWSEPIYCFTQPRITKAKVSGGKLQVKWKKVSGATKYAVYASTKKTSGYKKVATVSGKKSSVSVKKLGKKKINKKKTYYVYVVTLKKVNGRMNDSGRLYYWNTKNTSFGYF